MTGPARPWHLPAPITPLIGRDKELAVASRAIIDRQVRLLTLTGPPGTGKTRLALEVAEHVRESFEDGVWFVPLGSVQRADLVLLTTAQTLGIRQIGRRPLLEALAQALRDRRILLVLDNFEHLLAASGTLVDVLSACPGVKILATSRARLRISGEHQLVVPPLALPDLSALPTPDELSDVPAVRLFVERTRALHPNFSLSPANARSVAELCVRLDGLPLAIELAAARGGLLDPAALLARAGSRLRLLTDGPLDLPPRQRTLRAAIAWSEDLLSDGERRVFRALGVFRAGCTLDAAQAVCTDTTDTELDVLHVLEALVDRSLLRRVNEPGEPLRVDMLETIREYAVERLAAHDELELVQQRMADHFAALAEQATNPQLDGPDGPRLMAILERDHDNVRAVLRWFLDRGQAEESMCLAGGMWSFWEKRGYWSEGIRSLEAALALGPEAKSVARARALLGLAIMHRERSEYAAAARCARQSLALQRELGQLLPGSRLMFADVVALAGDPATGAAAVAEAIANATSRANARLGLAWAGLVGGQIATYAGDFDTARAHYEAGLQARAGGSGNEVDANLLHALGVVSAGAGDAATARQTFEEALVQFRARGEPRGVARVLLSLGALLARTADPALARATVEESLAVFRRLGEACGVALSSLMLGLPLPAGMLAELGQYALAAWWRVSVGRDPPPASDLGAWCVLPAEAAIPSGRRAAGKHGLTRRELEVLALMARRYSNRQIADELVLSIRTVERHISNIYAKTGLSSRRLAETYADYVFT
jgi:predicted ATPase/DNA-binding CsgD family transcriptional regulator